MKNKSTLQRKLTRSLAVALANEAAHLRKLRLSANLSGIGGGSVAGLALMAAHQNFGFSVLWLVVFGAIGGFLIGLSLSYSSFAKQWPILRPFINEQAVQKADRNENL